MFILTHKDNTMWSILPIGGKNSILSRLDKCLVTTRSKTDGFNPIWNLVGS